jgi:hypothetical protein
MCIERNRDILFWCRAKSRVSRYVRNCGGMQLVLPNPTTLAIPATAGLVHCHLTLLLKVKVWTVTSNAAGLVREALRCLYGDTCHVGAHPSCPRMEPSVIRTLLTGLSCWRSLIAVPRGTVKREPFRINLRRLPGCCDSSIAASASRPSTINDFLPCKRRI